MVNYGSQPNLADANVHASLRAGGSAITNPGFSSNTDQHIMYNNFSNRHGLNNPQKSRPRSKDYGGIKSLRSQGALRHFGLAQNSKAVVSNNLPPVVPQKAKETTQQSSRKELNQSPPKNNTKPINGQTPLVAPNSTGSVNSGKA